MGKKKQEMAQVYNGSKNEFIFGEQGGKGKNLSSFLKNLSLTGPSNSNSQESIDEMNSTIYGSLSYSKGRNGSNPMLSHGAGFSTQPPIKRTTSMGASFVSEHRRDVSPRSATRNDRHVKEKYTDLDDDWNAELQDEVSKPVVPPPLLDSLHPDLTVPIPAPKSDVKQSLDEEDYKTKAEVNKLNLLKNKYAKFKSVLSSETIINIQELRRLSWNGIPNELRALSWSLLLGYLPTNKSRQSSTVKRKRQEYQEGISSISVGFDENSKPETGSNGNREALVYHQINIDVKRTNPTIKLYANKSTQMSLRKILFLWAMRHPASGYVQGINDLATPFYQIFLNHYLWQLQKQQSKNSKGNDSDDNDSDLSIPGYLSSGEDLEENALLADKNLENYTLENFDTSKLSQRVVAIIEADTYWCLSRLLENITDNYIHEQPGIIRQVNELKNLVSKIDYDLIKHFDVEGVEFLQFSFRWMNCLLMRELPIDLIIRMWDTYLSEQPLGFSTFHTYVCAAFLIKFSGDLKTKDFQEILLFLQNPPTFNWKEKDIELMLSEAFMWQTLYKNAAAHLR
ncbi:GYP1 [Candida theae]|uniref:Oxidant-induced cell-cycle arrest protein 5 n=1 Tax=Candida theae TaxID=1198502 RepID=A0AAD5FY73_9ASCO|nr:GYP1 [Candida theae]KAI5957682.1 GYP1 [Candida theae]